MTSAETRQLAPLIANRRNFLALGGGVLGATALVSCSSTSDKASPDSRSATELASSPPSTLGVPTAGVVGATAPPVQLFTDEGMNFEASFGLGGSGTNAAAGEVLTAVADANAATGGATYQSYYDAFVVQGDRLAEAAHDAAGKGHDVTATDRYLRAATYYDQALFFVLGTSTPEAEERTYTTMDDAWTRGAELSGYERVEIPYEDTVLPAWFMPAREPDGSPASGRRPLVIVNNGSDGQLVETYGYGGKAANDRGMHALMFEGPGQGRMLFVEKIPFRPDWEAVIGPIIDEVSGRGDVDRDRIGLTGWSEGGELVARAAAFEDRLSAVVSDPGAVDVYLAFPEALRSVAASGDESQVNAAWADGIVPGATPAQRFELRKRLEIYSAEALEQARRGEVPTDWYGLSRRIQEFQVRDVADRISMPILVTNYAEEQFYPGQATELAGLIGDNAEVVDFTVAEGAQYHCAPLNPQWRNEVILDWIAQRLRR